MHVSMSMLMYIHETVYIYVHMSVSMNVYREGRLLGSDYCGILGFREDVSPREQQHTA